MTIVLLYQTIDQPDFMQSYHLNVKLHTFTIINFTFKKSLSNKVFARLIGF